MFSHVGNHQLSSKVAIPCWIPPGNRWKFMLLCVLISVCSLVSVLDFVPTNRHVVVEHTLLLNLTCTFNVLLPVPFYGDQVWACCQKQYSASSQPKVLLDKIFHGEKKDHARGGGFQAGILIFIFKQKYHSMQNLPTLLMFQKCNVPGYIEGESTDDDIRELWVWCWQFFPSNGLMTSDKLLNFSEPLCPIK